MNPKKRLDLVVSELESEILVLDRHSGKIHQLNVTASNIWRCCDGSVSVAEIAECLATDYGIKIEVAKQDVAAAIGQLKELGLLSEQ